jgi:hypothetical protein
MKNIIVGIAVAAISFAACNSANNKRNDNKVSTDTTKTQQQTNNTQTKGMVSIKEIINGYLQLKNALVNDNGNDAANGGKAILDAEAKFDKSSLSAQQKKVYDDVADDIKDNAEHIRENSGKIAHQRQHFDMLSQDMYDLVKAFSSGQTLYKDYCPMYNNRKGASWISETKEIKNPYLGKKMPTCGEVKEEIK